MKLKMLMIELCVYDGFSDVTVYTNVSDESIQQIVQGMCTVLCIYYLLLFWTACFSLGVLRQKDSNIQCIVFDKKPVICCSQVHVCKKQTKQCKHFIQIHTHSGIPIYIAGTSLFNFFVVYCRYVLQQIDIMENKVVRSLIS